MATSFYAYGSDMMSLFYASSNAGDGVPGDEIGVGEGFFVLRECVGSYMGGGCIPFLFLFLRTGCTRGECKEWGVSY